jgi:D-alanine-D-alanine ligase
VLSLEEKFLAGEGQNITPARYDADPEIRQEISDKVKADLLKVAQILNIEGYARIDAFVRVLENDEVETIIIEVNSLPGMTPATCIFHQTAINGYKPYDFIDKILTYGMDRNHKRAQVH